MKAIRWAAAVAVSACADADGGDSNPARRTFPFLPETGQPAAFGDAFEIVDTLVLEEDPAADIVTARPRVRFDGKHFLVADFLGYQARVYDTNGRLLDVRGRMGDGPGELLNPMSARRAPDGRLLVTDIRAMRLTLFPLEPEGEAESLMVPILPYDAVALEDQRYLVTGFSPSIYPSSSRPMLHIWDAATETLELSFFPPPRPDYLNETAGEGEWADVAVRNDTIWTVSAYTDSVFRFQTDGSHVGSVPLPVVEQARPASPDDTTAVLWTADSIHLLNGGRIVVQLARKAGFRTRLRANYLVIMDVDGTPQATVAGTPRLRTVANDLFYFQNPDRMEPNHWLVARWSAS